jgi:hypothetical protein
MKNSLVQRTTDTWKLGEDKGLQCCSGSAAPASPSVAAERHPPPRSIHSRSSQVEGEGTGGPYGLQRLRGGLNFSFSPPWISASPPNIWSDWARDLRCLDMFLDQFDQLNQFDGTRNGIEDVFDTPRPSKWSKAGENANLAAPWPTGHTSAIQTRRDVRSPNTTDPALSTS